VGVHPIGDVSPESLLTDGRGTGQFSQVSTVGPISHDEI